MDNDLYHQRRSGLHNCDPNIPQFLEVEMATIYRSRGAAQKESYRAPGPSRGDTSMRYEARIRADDSLDIAARLEAHRQLGRYNAGRPTVRQD